MKNYILGILTGSIIFILCYLFFGWGKLSYKIDNDIESGSIIENEHTKDIINNNDDYLTQGFPTYTGLTDITDEIQGQLYNPYSPYGLSEIGRVYSFSGMILGLLHNNVLSMINGEEWLGWKPWFTVYDAETGDLCHRGNRITGLVQEGDKLIMTILDRCGGGSMDGYVSAYQLGNDGKWELNACYNYDNWGIFTDITPNEYRNLGNDWGTWQLDKLTPTSIDECKGNIKIEYYR